MSIATDSETTSVAARERWLHQELRRKERSGFDSYRTGEKRRAVVAASLLCSDLISAFVALFTVDRTFGLSLTETALTGLPVLIGCLLGGLYSAIPPPGERLRQDLGTLAFVSVYRFREYFQSNIWQSNIWIAAALRRLWCFCRLLRRSPDAPCPRALWGGDDLAGKQPSARSLLSTGTWSATGRPRELRGDPPPGSPGRRVRSHGNEARFRRMKNAAKLAHFARVL
jgi:hypothetical protein